MAFESPNALAASRSLANVDSGWSGELPHLDSLVQTAADKVSAIRSKGHRVDAVHVALLAFESLDKEAGGRIPHANALVQRACCNIAVVWRDRNRGNTIVDEQLQHLLVRLNVPQSHCAVATP